MDNRRLQRTGIISQVNLMPTFAMQHPWLYHGVATTYTALQEDEEGQLEVSDAGEDIPFNSLIQEHTIAITDNGTPVQMLDTISTPFVNQIKKRLCQSI